MQEFNLPYKLFAQPEFQSMSVYAKLLYCYLARYKSQCYSSDFSRHTSELIKDSGFKINTFKKAEKELLEKGFIKITTRIEELHNDFYSFIDSKGKKLKLSLGDTSQMCLYSLKIPSKG